MNQNSKSTDNLLKSLFKNYPVLIVSVVLISLVVNGLGLVLPRINAWVIDSLQKGEYNRDNALLVFVVVGTAILIMALVQSVVSNITAERIAADLRSQIITKLSRQSFGYINQVTTSKLLTNLTSDVDAVKAFINQGLVFAFAAVVQLVGSVILLLSINYKLAIPILLTIPLLVVTFGFIFSRIEKYFKLGQEAIDKLNKVINETIVGSAVVRVLFGKNYEVSKFEVVNQESKHVGTKIVSGFAGLIPIINLVVNGSLLIVVGFGGIQIIDGTLSAGDFSSFFLLIYTFIFPIVLLGFLGSSVGRAFATYTRLREVIEAPEPVKSGTLVADLNGEIELKDVTLDIESKRILGDISFEIKPGSRVGILGPTAAGKTQIFYLITGLIQPNSGEVRIDGELIGSYDADSLYSQMGMVFQDSIIFNTSIRENIAFRSEQLSDEQIWKAIETAELKDFVDTLPDGLDTKISERGASLSGGQKQRLTLARALVLNPKILLLDDFTARVDIQTEKKIFENLKRNYPGTTIVAITQKIKSVEDFDNVILLMEGELVAQGKHQELLDNSMEYQQIYNSQKRSDE